MPQRENEERDPECQAWFSPYNNKFIHEAGIGNNGVNCGKGEILVL
jgi:hypothetical protein